MKKKGLIYVFSLKKGRRVTKVQITFLSEQVKDPHKTNYSLFYDTRHLNILRPTLK